MRTDGTVTLAVTGGIGSGKSLVCSLFAEKGIPVCDTDSLAKGLYDTVPGLVGRISDAMGTCLALPDGRLDRKKLASIVFSDMDRLAVLESIVHPEVRDSVVRWKEKMLADRPEFLIIESAIILRKPVFSGLYDKVLYVDAPLRLRVGRAALRDSCPQEKIMERVLSQQDMEGVAEDISGKIDYIIVNDKDRAFLEGEVDKIYRKIVKK